MMIYIKWKDGYQYLEWELIFLKKIENKNESKIKRFDSFLESKNEKYSIYEFFYDLHPRNRNKFS